MGTVSRLPERIRTTAPIIGSEAEAFDSIEILIRELSAASDAFASSTGAAPSTYPAIAGSGLLGITVPSEEGGADVSNVALGEIMLSAASANRVTAAALANHFHSIELLRGSAATGPCSYFYGRALAGDLFLMIGDVDDHEGGSLRLVPEIGKPGFRLTGSIESAIDPIHADWIVLRLREDPHEHAIFIPRMTAGLRLAPEQACFSNVHIDADCFVSLADHAVSTAGPLDNLLQSAQKLGWAERKLGDRIALHARLAAGNRTFSATYLSALGLTVSRIESGKAALERAGRKIDNAQINTDAAAVQHASFVSAIALSSAAEAFDLTCDIDASHQPSDWSRADPYGHVPIGASLLENAIH